MNQQFYLGIVESRNDTLKLGRVQVRVFGVHTEALTDIPTADLPWAIPLMPATSASLSGIGHSGSQYVEGTLVFLFFQDGESKQQPIILGSAHGIPLDKSPFGNDNSENIETSGINSRVTSTVLATNKGTLSDSSGQPVVDSSGAPVLVGSSESGERVDISKMVAKFGSNVTLVYNTLKDYGIKDPYAQVAILSNVAKECGFVLKREGMQYSTVSRLKKIFSKYFQNMSDSEASTYIGNEQKLANLVYANRYGNGNAASGDGFNFRGGGFIQLTFKSNYQNVGSKIGVDLVSDPSKVNDPVVAAKAVAQFFINAYGGHNKLSFTELNSALIKITKTVNSGGFSNDFPKVQTFSTLCIIKDSPEDAAANAEKSEITKPNDPKNDIKKDASQTEINSGIVGGKSISAVSKLGFKDPNNKYPLNTLLKEQDTNRLGRRNTMNTLVDTKIKNRRSDIRSIGGTFSEPDAPYNAQYPYNHVYSTESGHALEFDDTVGNERINLFHTSGTFTEIDKFGNQVNKIIGDNFTIIERNGYVFIDGTLRLTVGSDVKLVVAGNLDIEVDGNVNYNVGGDVTWKVGGDVKYGIGGINSIHSEGSMDIDSATINLNSGTSDDIGFSSRSGTSNDYPTQEPENFRGATTLDFDSSSEAEVDEHHKRELASGAITQKQLDDGKAASPSVVDDTVPPVVAEPLPASCSIFEGKVSIPASTQVSKSFTLGMLSSNAVVSKYQVTSQHGLSVSAIACNLKKLAENCLDPIKSKYPNMFVTSGFRIGSGKSQHERGFAADMQFTGASKSDFFDIAQWIKGNVLYDQLLLEYKTTGSGLPWIHISYNSDGNRKQVMTFMNDKSTGTGLRKLQS